MPDRPADQRDDDEPTSVTPYRRRPVDCRGPFVALPASAQTAPATVEKVADFPHQVTGVTVSEDGRIFVNFPRWTEDAPVSVAEVGKDGSIRPYPNGDWNAWRNARRDELSAGDHFVCVQSVVADGRGSVWALDAGAPAQEPSRAGRPKLVRIELATNAATKTLRFDESVAPPGVLSQRRPFLAGRASRLHHRQRRERGARRGRPRQREGRARSRRRPLDAGEEGARRGSGRPAASPARRGAASSSRPTASPCRRTVGTSTGRRSRATRSTGSRRPCSSGR